MPPILVKAAVLVAAAAAFYVSTLVDAEAAAGLKVAAGFLLGALAPQLGAKK